VTAVSDLEKLSVWIALRSPPAEEGNNTGVSIALRVIHCCGSVSFTLAKLVGTFKCC